MLLKPLVIDALVHIHDIPRATAEAVFNELAGLTDNQRWVDILRGKTSRKVSWEPSHLTRQRKPPCS